MQPLENRLGQLRPRRTADSQTRRSSNLPRWGYIHSYGANDERLDPPGLLSRYDYRRPRGGIGGATQPPASVQCFWELYLDGIG